MKHSFLYLLAFLPFYLFVSCTQDNYDKGEGEYSLMRADFVEAHVGSDKRIDYIVTDDGDSLATEPRFTTRSIETADTTYRVILYYNKVKNDAGHDVAKAKGMSIVPTLSAHSSSQTLHHLSPKTDPVKFESIWTARNLRYVNVSILLMTGTPDDDDAMQSISLINEGIRDNADGSHTARYRLGHDQGGVPEYYSQQCYFSIPVRNIKADSLRLVLQTYDGEVSKTVSLK